MPMRSPPFRAFILVCRKLYLRLGRRFIRSSIICVTVSRASPLGPLAELLIGALFGFVFGDGNDNLLAGAGSGALVGVFIGWFVAAAVLQKR